MEPGVVIATQNFKRHLQPISSVWRPLAFLPVTLSDSLGKNTGVGCHSLLRGTFSTQGSNPSLLHCRQILYHLSHQGSPASRENRFISTPPQAALSAELPVERQGRGPQFPEGSLALRAPSPPRDTGHPCVKWQASHSLLGRPEADQAALCQGAGGSFRESEPRPADPALFMPGQFNGPH